MVDPRICIIGAGGMLGRELVLACPAADTFDLPELDITSAARVNETLSRVRPDVVVNVAAYTDVDGCETNKDVARAVNVDGVANLALVCRDTGCRMVHVSTDYVFDGRSDRPYRPDDPVCPINQYGRTKAEGEARLREILADHLIVRSSWMFSVFGRNFVKTILELASQRDVIHVVTDQVGSPTYARDLAGALLALVKGNERGIIHFCNSGFCSWYEFAKRIVERASPETSIKPTTSNELARPARRPPYSVLDTDAVTRILGTAPRHWEDALGECLSEMGRAGDGRRAGI